MSDDFRLGLAQDRHDHPACGDCGTRTWRGDLLDGVCPRCFDADGARWA